MLFLHHLPSPENYSPTKKMGVKSKILIIGATGYIGKLLVEAGVKAGHPIFVLLRESTVSDPSKSSLINFFKKYGVTVVNGDLFDHESLVKALKLVDVVFSTIDLPQVGDQLKIIAAIKEAGNIKKFYPSEYGNDVDRVHGVEPATTAFASKAKIRRAIEDAGIPHTYVVSYCSRGSFLQTLAQLDLESKVPPRDKVVIFGDGNAKVVYNEEDDIGAYTIKSVDDPRTLNKILYVKPPGNIYSFNDLISLWEKKIGKTMEKIYLSEDRMLKNIQEAPVPLNTMLAIGHSVFVKGDQTNFEIEPSFGVEASALYPDVTYATVDEYLNRYV